MNISKKLIDSYDIYNIYDCTKHDRGKYLNTWFWCAPTIRNKITYHQDKIITFKKVDKRTSEQLYNRHYNAVSIFICKDTYTKNKDKYPYYMRAILHSVDDFCFSVWFNTFSSLDELHEIRLEIMKYVDSKKELNGDDFVHTCLALGGDEVDYD